MTTKKGMLSKKKIVSFQKTIWKHYQRNGRTFSWRNTKDPYRILVSEIMLQQTQVGRVVPYYNKFIETFPDIFSLARAPFKKVLGAWSGLGYNRRAKFLHETARIIIKEYKGIIPEDAGILAKLPGIGPGTACAISAFAFNNPAVFIETNIRAVFIHHFFKKEKIVSDRKIFPLIEQTLDKKYSRKWYYALMDYGAALKEKYKNPGRKSAQYRKQPSFKNSNRRIRGEILKLLVVRKSVPVKEIKNHIRGDAKFLQNAIAELKKEKFIETKDGIVRLRD